MPLVVPNPTVPTNGQSLDAAPLLANLNAVYQAIQQFDASQIQAGTLVASAFNAAINPNTLLKETTSPFVSTGLVWSIVSGLSGTMTGGVIYYNGIRVTVNSIASNTFLASKDIYIDVDVNGNVTYNSVTNGAAAPALTTNSVRIAKAISGASLTSFTQTGIDSLGNLIYPAGAIGGANFQSYRVNRNNNGSNIIETGARVQSGWVAVPGSANSAITSTITFPVPFQNVPIVIATYGGDTPGATSTLGAGGINVKQAYADATNLTTTNFVAILATRDTTSWAVGNTLYVQWLAIGV